MAVTAIFMIFASNSSAAKRGYVYALSFYHLIIPIAMSYRLVNNMVILTNPPENEKFVAIIAHSVLFVLHVFWIITNPKDKDPKTLPSLSAGNLIFLVHFLIEALWGIGNLVSKN
jgi:hypothetical protein